jgi:hypothetical protein
LTLPFPQDFFQGFLYNKIIPKKSSCEAFLYLSLCPFFLLKRNATFSFIKITPNYILRSYTLEALVPSFSLGINEIFSL